jgi:hypothetical protein
MNELPSLDRSAFQLASLDDADDVAQYWRQQTPQDRLIGVETLRQIMYGYDPATERLQRVLELAELE